MLLPSVLYCSFFLITAASTFSNIIAVVTRERTNKNIGKGERAVDEGKIDKAGRNGRAKQRGDIMKVKRVI